MTSNENIEVELINFDSKNNTKDFDLNIFLKNYKPKSLYDDLKVYILHPKLKNYELINYHNKIKLIPKRTYIKYISMENTFKYKNIGNNIKSGGILIGCGKLANDKFVHSNNPNEWRFLLLKFDPSAIIDEKGNLVRPRIEPRTFLINMSKHYIFYRSFQGDARSLMERRKYKIEVEFKDRHGKIVR